MIPNHEISQYILKSTKNSLINNLQKLSKSSCMTAFTVFLQINKFVI